MSNRLDPDQARHFVGPDLGPYCLQKLSAHKASRQRVKLNVWYEHFSASILCVYEQRRQWPDYVMHKLILASAGHLYDKYQISCSDPFITHDISITMLLIIHF